MKRKILTNPVLPMVIFIAGCLAIAGCGHDRAATTAAPTVPPGAAAAAQPTVDLHNTVCPVSGDPVGDSKLVETYQSKTYHFCCDDCPPKFCADPSKYANAVAADPAKYGVKP